MSVKQAKILNKYGQPGKMAIEVLVPEFRVSYPHMFQPYNANPQDKNSKPKYGICMLWFVKDEQERQGVGVDLTILKQAVAEVRADKWGADPKKWPTLHLPFHKGDETEDKAKKAELGGNIIYANANTGEAYKPFLLGPNKAAITDPNQFYPGCFAVAKVTVKAYEMPMKKGVTLYLASVMKTRDGEPIAGGKSDPLDDFSSVPMPDGAVEDAGGTEPVADPLGMP